MAIKTEIKDNVGFITVQNGELNIIPMDHLAEIKRQVDVMNAENSVKAIVFYSDNPKGFSTGADIEEMSHLSEAEAYEFSRFGQNVMNTIESSPKVTVASLNGNYCVGGGLELVMACRYRVSTPEVKFSLPENRLSIIPGWGGTQRLQYHIGVEAAENMIKTGKSIRGLIAYQMGLVDYLAADSPKEEALYALEHPNLHSRSQKNVLKSISLPQNYEEEARAFAACFRNGTPQGMQRFLEKNALVK